MPAPRPEFENPPEIFYNATEARRYTVNSRVRKVQRDMSLRALELMNLPAPVDPSKNFSALLLDLGCGSGISGDVLTEQGHAWIGVDISSDMLAISKEDELRQYGLLDASDKEGEEEGLAGSRTRVDTSQVKWGLISDDESQAGAEDEDEGGELEGSPDGAGGPQQVEVVRNDIGEGIPFRPGTFDGCISISAIQWLCHSSKKGEVPQRRLMALFQRLYNSLRRGAKAVLQFYPSSPDQIHMITRAAMKCGFSGGVVVDFPHSAKAKKHYLVVQAGQIAGGFVPPPGLTDVAQEGDEEDEEYDEYGSSEGSEMWDASSEEAESVDGGRKRARVAGRDRERVKRARRATSQDHKRRRKDNRPVTGTREWVLLKKEERRQRGLATSTNSKYTMRRRRPRF